MTGAKETFQIFIALPSGDICTVKRLSREMFVYQLKSRVELKAGIPANIFSLFFMNVQLRDQDTLKTYHLKRGCIVRVKLELELEIRLKGESVMLNGWKLKNLYT